MAMATGSLMTAGSGGSTVNYSMEMANRNKRSVAIDLKAADGRAALLRLLETADVFLTNFLPSVLERLGLGVDEMRALNPPADLRPRSRLRRPRPRCRHACLRLHRLLGPRRHRRDHCAARAVGAAAPARGRRRPLRRDPPRVRRRGCALSPRTHRRRIGGRRVAARYRVLDDRLRRAGRAAGAFRQSPELGHPRVSLPNPLAANYRCGDGRWLTLCCLQPDKYWPDMCSILARPDLLADERFVDMRSRAEHSGGTRRRAGGDLRVAAAGRLAPGTR